MYAAPNQKVICSWSRGRVGVAWPCGAMSPCHIVRGWISLRELSCLPGRAVKVEAETPVTSGWVPIVPKKARHVDGVLHWARASFSARTGVLA